MEKIWAIVDSAESGEAYDQLIGDGNRADNIKIMAAIDTLLDQTCAIENVLSRCALGEFGFEGCGRLDEPEAIKP